MLQATMYQQSMTVVDPTSIGLARDTFERHLPELLPRMLPLVQPRRLFTSRQGSPTCCLLRVVAMLLLQFRFGLSEPKTIQGFKTHVLGTIDSQFVTGSAISDAATRPTSSIRR